jgi:dihydroorotate dehydrogenase (fumarate)
MNVDLTTNYLGLALAHPVMASASPLTGDLDHLHQLAEAGASAVVLPSLFEEQIEHDAMAVHFGLEFGADSSPEAPSGYLPELNFYNTGPANYLNLVRDARRELKIPVIASLNGVSKGGWTLYARVLADEGVNALELNIYLIAADPDATSVQVEHQYLELVQAVRRAVDVPLALKIGPYFSAMGHMARQLVDAGADGLVLFNRFYQPDIDLQRLEVKPDLVLSSPEEARLVLRWIALLYGRVDCSLAATTGVHHGSEATKLVLAGADVTMMASALLRHGPRRLTEVRDDLAGWLAVNGYQSVSQAKGSLSQRGVSDPVTLTRSNYMQTLVNYSADWRAKGHSLV